MYIVSQARLKRWLKDTFFQTCSADAMEPARLRTSNGGFPIISFTVLAHESVIQKCANPCSGPSAEEFHQLTTHSHAVLISLPRILHEESQCPHILSITNWSVML
jgi:hypothetical protein